MEWNGMEWNGMEWNGMEWNGMEWNGMEWNGMEWNGMEWNGMEWNGMEWNGMEWNGMEQNSCSYRLVPNDFHDSKPRGSQACVFTDLSVPAVDQSISGSLLIDICGIFTWSIASCMVMSGAYYENGHWKDIWYAGSNQTTFAIEKRLGVTIHLKWNNTLSSRYYGYILSLDVRCTRKFGRTDVDSCLLFKVKGTQMDKRPSTPSPSNDTAGTATAVGSQGVPESSAVPVMIVTGGICGVFAVVLISLMTFCLWKRKGLNTMSMRYVIQRKGAPSVDMTSSPLYDVNEYQCVNQQEAAIYTTPQKTGYQDLVFTRPTYQPLVVQVYAAITDHVIIARN
ncbi:hypothetical protein QZH41_018624 [Actinostola sp. cb2023]|nr:hypothetical protein QZH41_018624 [Actinostola sp. cb2023]